MSWTSTQRKIQSKCNVESVREREYNEQRKLIVNLLVSYWEGLRCCSYSEEQVM